jgi:hypothetical protein
MTLMVNRAFPSPTRRSPRLIARPSLSLPRFEREKRGNLRGRLCYFGASRNNFPGGSMRSYLVCSLGVAMLLAAGCGDEARPGTDARDGAGDGPGDGGSSVDRVDMRQDMSSTGGTGGSTGGTGGSIGGSGGDTGGTGGGGTGGGGTGGGGTGGTAGSTGGTGGTAGSTGGTGGGVDGGPDAGGSDGGAPTCNDGIKNSDETGIDCGGHCGKCGPGNACLVNADCTFACKADKTCAACNVAADCPGIESECDHRTCTAGACGNMREAAGTVLTVQATGDCKRRQCAADGTVASVNDDTDLPDDRNPCTNDICTSGTVSHTMMPANSNCGGANHCNANGQCVGCAVAADCPGTDTACRTRTCTAGGVCGFSFTAANTKLVDPTAGDCKGLQCDGAGNAQVMNDSADLPVDGNVCTTDECSSGTPSHRPVASGTACGGSLVCDGAANCVECLTATSCPGTDTECQTRSCVQGECGISNVAAGTLIAAQVPRDCKKNVCNGQGASGSVNDDLDLPVDGNACTQDVCTAGMPSNPFVTAGNSCGANTICDGQGACVTCLTASSCPGTDTECRTRTCVNGACGVSNAPAGMLLTTQTAGDCKRAQCDGSGLSMVVTDDADAPVDGNSCTGDVCTAGVPSNPNLASGSACGTNQVCNGQGACVGCVTAANCGTDTACRTFTCNNGQCGVDNVAAGTLLTAQTAGDCKRVQCDGTGQTQTVTDDTDKPVDGNACTQDLCTAGIPSNPPETAGTTCSQNGGTRCNGSGTAPACVQCLAPTDCSGNDTECHVRTCSTAGVCGISNTSDGTLVTGQTAGDCKKNVCMTGNQVTVNDDNDVPVDGNGCTMDACSNGSPANPPLPSNSPCSENGGTRCNGSATAPACVQCLQNGDCGTNTECQMFTCSLAGACSTNDVANGTPLAAQATGDCKRNVCNGSGGTTVAVDNADLPVDGNACTADLCTSGTPSNPSLPASTACTQNGGTLCNGSATAPACVQCVDAGDCGTDTFCKTYTCSAAGVCGSSNTADGTALPGQTAGDCKRNVCMTGAAAVVNDDNDVDVDGNLCTDDVCMNGTPSNPNLPLGEICGPSLTCDGNGGCVGCFADSDCPLPANDCQTRVCNQGTCGFNNVAQNMPISTQTTGDCKTSVCDGAGGVTVINDDLDKPATSNQCLQSVCTAGVPSNPPATQGATCNQNNGTKCDGAGACVQCFNATECPGDDTECHSRTCTTGLCGISNQPLGTAVPTQISGDCRKNQCDGNGDVANVGDDSDNPVNNNECAFSMCLGGAVNTDPVGHGTICTQNGGRTCDGAGACVNTFCVLRSNMTTSGNGSAIVIEERRLDGVLVTTTNLPTAASGSNLPLVQSGTSTSEGSLSLSGDGRYLILGGYGTTPGSATGTVVRVLGRIDAGNPALVDTSTQVPAATIFNSNNLRGATSQDGTGFWASGAGGGTGGIWWIPLGGANPVRVVSNPNNTRWPLIFDGQLYVSTVEGNGTITPFAPVRVGTGLPTTAGQNITALPGLPTTNAGSPYGYAFLDLNPNVTGVDRLYIADGNLGIQKWTLASTGGTWTLAATFTVTPAAGFRGVTALVTGANVTVIGTTAEVTGTRIFSFVDTGTGTPTGSLLVTATSPQGYRGVALAPHL